MLDEIARRRQLAGARILDVGSGHGWFLECAAERGAHAIGIEPDRAVAEQALARGLDVRCGFFPNDLPPGEQFDVVAFNDVFEHLPDPPGILAAASDRLVPEGMLAISIPTADGLAYRTGFALARTGLRAPLDRLWQRGLPSPHLWYFTERSLTELVTSNGFRPLGSGRLPSIERAGLRERVAADPSAGAIARFAVHGIALAAPVLNHRRCSDAMWLLFAKTGRGGV